MLATPVENTPLNALCPICASRAGHKVTMSIDAKTFKPTTHGQVYECTECLAGFLHPRPTPEETANFYNLDAYYTTGQSHMAQATSSTFLSKLRTHLAWRLDKGTTLLETITAALPSNAKVVDIGCGSGRLVTELVKRGHNAVGVEREAKSISLHRMDISVFKGTAEALPTELIRGTYDAVIFSHVLEHLTDPVGALRNAASLLKPAGGLFVEVPNNDALIAVRSGLSWEHLDIPRHVNFFNEASLSKAMQQAGLKPEQTYFGGYCRYFYDSYIETEQKIFDQLSNENVLASGTKRNSGMRSWGLLALTALAKERIKYDSIGMVARKA
jgi:2-polyprenyl-3-methyl-5-hydroxy-6-metoxy-1,4-benzoquinol methylase